MYRRIRDLREDADLTQTEIAKMLNCSQAKVSRIAKDALDNIKKWIS